MQGQISGSTAAAIAECVRDLVAVGHIQPGDSLPPIRSLADDLGLNRNTVATAYRQLVSMGLAVTRSRAGTVITTLPPPDTELDPAPGAMDLASGNPDPALLPDLYAAVSASRTDPALYGAPAVHPSLRVAAHQLFADVPAGELVITHGAVDAVERLLAAYLIRGDLVALESPCFLASIGTIRLNGYRTAAVAVDEHGMTPDGLDRALREGARAVIITPRAHNPTGASLNTERAQQLSDLLQGYPEVLVIEDDHLSMVATAAYHRVTAATTHRWALIRSVAKFLGPDLRVALTYTDPATADALKARLRAGKTWVSHLLQGAAAYLLTDPDSIALVASARQTYQRRLSGLTTELLQHNITPFGMPDGLNMWIDLPAQMDADRLHTELARAGWATQPGRIYTAGDSPPPHALRITTASLTQSTAHHFAAALADLLHAP
ncbi:UNVERIFIED_CONTAM: GntR family transcriptional regulator [Williamsia faeni]